MAQVIEFRGKDQTVEPQLAQVYDALPPPKNNEQYKLLLLTFKEDREELFAYARYKLRKELIQRLGTLAVIASALHIGAIDMNTVRELLRSVFFLLK